MLIISSLLRPGLQSDVRSGLLTTRVCIFVPYACYVSHPSRRAWFDTSVTEVSGKEYEGKAASICLLATTSGGGRRRRMSSWE